jgi:deoxyribodipyrimidine photo-lyase
MPATATASSDSAPTIVWFREDLRLADNPALVRALERGAPVVPVFVLDDESPAPWQPGGAARWWLHHSLRALHAALGERGASLVLRAGPADRVIPDLAAETGAGAVVWNRLYEGWARERDARIKQTLKDRGLIVESVQDRVLHEPWVPRTGNGDPYKVFTPFWKALLKLDPPAEPLPAPTGLQPGPAVPSDRLADWNLVPTTPDWAGGLRATWTPGEVGAQARLTDFLDTRLARYPELRNRPDTNGTSALSPHLRWGEVSPRQVWHATQHAMERDGRHDAGMAFLRELGWRDFSYHLLYWWPDIADVTWKPAFQAFPWRYDRDAYRAWMRGRTGYPIVDAGMRELYETGWMHNRVRMIVGSFLVKDLLLPWQWGEAWFWDTLVDADPANNAASWQWVAGCGADAAPYFRIFNPVTQGQKFDPAGAYVRRWVPEIAELPDPYLHAPWTAPEMVRRGAGVQLGTTYPAPIVDHKAARKRALDAFEAIKQPAT